jgi:hypothetical protein
MQIDINDALLRALKPPARGRLELWDTHYPWPGATGHQQRRVHMVGPRTDPVW